jgi:cytochrome d ubiquinol oxidase subunit I
LGVVVAWRGVLFERRWLLWIYVASVGLAILANQVGWIAAEVGRQPWIVHPEIVRNQAGEPVFDSDGFLQYAETTSTLPDGTSVRRVAGLRTDDGVSKAVKAEQVAASIVMFLVIYALLGAVWLYVLNQKFQAGPEPPEEGFGTSRFGEMLTVAARQIPGRGLARIQDRRDSVGDDTT